MRALARKRQQQRGSAKTTASRLVSTILFDLWAERWRHREATGNVIIVRYADDCVPRTYRRKEVRCCARDGGRSSGAGRQGKAPNHRKLRRSRAVVVSVAEKAGMISSGVAQRDERKQTADDVSKA